APSFITGSLIARFGVSQIILTGCALLAGTALVASHGSSLLHFFCALVLLGVGWNFLFIGGSTLLTGTHSETERGKVQGTNDLLIFAMVTISSLLAGKLLHLLGWASMNLAMLPLISLVAITTLWLALRQRSLNTA
ncbi:MAG: MFS transporter, partial [Alcanivoracaceae bacterium]|nr:MFS transporter [Alcanivoracaceae bacterium]